MSVTMPRVTRIEMDSMSNFEVTITVTRRPSFMHIEQPIVSDIPADVRHALLLWLNEADA